MAHIQDRGPSWRPKSSRYRVRYRDPDNRERSKSFGRLVDAQRYESTTEAAKVRGDWIDPALGRTTLAEWAHPWFDRQKPTLKPKTIESYASLLRSRILPTFGNHPIATIRPSDVQTWIGGMVDEGLSASRVRQAHVVLSRMLKAAVREGLVARNVAQDAALPRLHHKEAAFLDPETVDLIAGAMPGQYGLGVRVMGTVGLRFGELAALRRRSVDVLRKRLRIDESMSEVNGELHIVRPKNHETRVVPLPAPLLVALELPGHMSR